MACGTGRITIPIAEDGIAITGLDISEQLLDYARKKANDQGVPIDWIHGDMTNFKLHKKYNLILMTGWSFLHLVTLESVEACLSCVKAHLTEKGKFIFDIFNPDLEILLRDAANWYPHSEYPDPDSEEMVVITQKTSYNRATQIMKLIFLHQIGEKEITEKAKLRIFFPQEIDALLQYNGFIIEAKYGDFEEQPFTSESGAQIFVCRLGR